MGGLKKRLENHKSTKNLTQKSIPVRSCVDLWFNNLFGYGDPQTVFLRVVPCQEKRSRFRPPLAPTDQGENSALLPLLSQEGLGVV